MSKTHHTPHGFTNNYVGTVTKSLRDLLRWQLDRFRNHLPPPPTLPIPEQAADLNFIHANSLAGANMTPAATWIGHASTLVQANGLNVLTDPVFSNRVSPVSFAGPKRAQPPGLSVEQVPHIDVVLVSHNHYDHLDRGSIKRLSEQAGGSPVFLMPLGLKVWLQELGISNAVELDWWEHHTHQGTEFHFTPAQHWSGRSWNDRNKTLWGAWSALGPDFHWYFSGDTGYSRDFLDTRERFAERQTPEKGGGFDVALIAVGACLPRWFMKEQHVDLDEAVQIHMDLAAKCSLGIHWGTFALADDPLDLPLHQMSEVLAGKGVAREAFFLLPVGGTRRFAKRAVKVL